MTVLNKYIYTPHGSTVINQFSRAPKMPAKASPITRKEEKELSRLRLIPHQKRTANQYRRLLLLARKDKPFNSMPKQSKKNAT